MYTLALDIMHTLKLALFMAALNIDGRVIVGDKTACPRVGKGGDSNNFLDWDLAELSRAIQTKHVSPVEVTRQLLDRIEAVDPILNCYISVLSELSLEQAVAAEKEIANGGWRGALHGVPIGLKDIVFTRGIRTTMGSSGFESFVPSFDSAVVELLHAAGAVIIGKQNTHQFAYGPTGDRSSAGPVKNPYDPSRMSGGSSSGSAAAVAAGLCYGAIGTDTGGSIRIPSSLCGVVGMKPTFGRISKFGIYPLSPSLDHVGALTRSVRDNAILLQALCGHDPRDPYSVVYSDDIAGPYAGGDLRGTSIGIPSDFFFDNLQAEVRSGIDDALRRLVNLGADVRDVHIPHLADMRRAHQILIAAESFRTHKDMLRDVPEQYDEEVMERLVAGSSISQEEEEWARVTQDIARREFCRALEDADAIATPTVQVTAPLLQQREGPVDGVVRVVREDLTRLTGIGNLTGFPGLSIPCRPADGSMPVGLQLLGEPYGEAELYRIAAGYESANCSRLPI